MIIIPVRCARVALLLVGSACEPSNRDRGATVGDTTAGPAAVAGGRADTARVPSATVDASGSFVLDTAPRVRYVASVWHTRDSATQRRVLEALRADSNWPGGVRPAGTLLLRARRIAQDGAEVVRLTQWPDSASAAGHAARARVFRLGGVAPVRTLLYTLTSHAAKPDASLVVADSSSVQFSEYVMKRRRAVDTLVNIAEPIVGAMTQAQPTLRWMVTLRSADSTSISLFGVWSTREGFEVFASQNTFGKGGAQGYWVPYARNEHAMFDVVAIRH